MNLRYLFSSLHYRRLVWHCDNANMQNKHTARLVGFTFEGVSRQCMVREGESGFKGVDVAWYSLLASEWPLIKTALEEWISSIIPSEQTLNRLEEIRLSLGWHPIDLGMPEFDSTSVPIADWTPRPLPTAPAFEGCFVRLEFIDFTRHLDEVIALYSLPGERNHYVMGAGPVSREEIQKRMETGIKYGSGIYALMLSDGSVGGVMSIIRVDRANGSAEFGIILGPKGEA